MKVYRFLSILTLGLLAASMTHPQARLSRRPGRQQSSMVMTPEERERYGELRAGETRRRISGRGFDASLEAALANPDSWAGEFITVYALPEWDRIPVAQREQYRTKIAQALRNIKVALRTEEMTSGRIEGLVQDLDLPTRIKTQFNAVVVQPLKELAGEVGETLAGMKQQVAFLRQQAEKAQADAQAAKEAAAQAEKAAKALESAQSRGADAAQVAQLQQTAQQTAEKADTTLATAQASTAAVVTSLDTIVASSDQPKQVEKAVEKAQENLEDAAKQAESVSLLTQRGEITDAAKAREKAAEEVDKALEALAKTLKVGMGSIGTGLYPTLSSKAEEPAAPAPMPLSQEQAAGLAELARLAAQQEGSETTPSGEVFAGPVTKGQQQGYSKLQAAIEYYLAAYDAAEKANKGNIGRQDKNIKKQVNALKDVLNNPSFTQNEEEHALRNAFRAINKDARYPSAITDLRNQTLELIEGQIDYLRKYIDKPVTLWSTTESVQAPEELTWAQFTQRLGERREEIQGMLPSVSMPSLSMPSVSIHIPETVSSAAAGARAAGRRLVGGVTGAAKTFLESPTDESYVSSETDIFGGPQEDPMDRPVDSPAVIHTPSGTSPEMQETFRSM